MTKTVDTLIMVAAILLCALFLVGCDARVTCDHRFIKCAHTPNSLGVSSYYYNPSDPPIISSELPIGIQY